MLVDPAYRRRGIATRLLRHVLDVLDNAGCTSVRLDATQMGATVYGTLGFQDEQEIGRVGGRRLAFRSRGTDDRIRGFQWKDWSALLELDRRVAGADRTKLLKRLLLEQPSSARVACSDGSLSGFALRRKGSYADLIGPLVALSEVAGRALLSDALLQSGRVPVLLDVPSRNKLAWAAVEEAGLTAQRRFIRMVRGTPAWEPSPLLWAGSGPEKG